MYTKEDVQCLIADLGDLKSDKPKTDAREAQRTAGDPNVTERYIGNRDIDFGQPRPNIHNIDLADIELGEPYMFGLALDIFDPVSGEVLRVCRPHRRDTGEGEVFLTPNQIAGAISNARSHRLHNERAGLIAPRPLSDEQAADVTKRQETARAQQVGAAERDHVARDIRERETGEAANRDHAETNRLTEQARVQGLTPEQVRDRDAGAGQVQA